VLTPDFAFAPSAIPPAAFSACLVVFIPDASHKAYINVAIYRRGNAAEMGRANAWSKVGKPILCAKEIAICEAIRREIAFVLRG
jgi:hypothetical protein